MRVHELGVIHSGLQAELQQQLLLWEELAI
jgi:hypothetical protein